MDSQKTPEAGKKARYPVAGLTKAQREVFEAIACGQTPPYYQLKSISALLKKGAIVKIGEKIICQDRFGTVKVPEYEVPFDIHYAWCQWCSEQPSDCDL